MSSNEPGEGPRYRGMAKTKPSNVLLMHQAGAWHIFTHPALTTTQA